MTSRITLNVPEVLMISIEVPGKLDNRKQAFKAIEQLGGCKHIQNSLLNTNRSPLILRLNSEDEASKSIPFNHTYTQQLLLRKYMHKSGKIVYNVEGVIIKQFNFTNLADYFIAPPLELHKKRSLSEMLDESVLEPYFMPPPLFTRLNSPFFYKYESNPFSKTTRYLKRLQTHKEEGGYTQKKDDDLSHNETVDLEDIEADNVCTDEDRRATKTSEDVENITNIISDSRDEESDRQNYAHMNNHDIIRKSSDDSMNLVWKFSDANVPTQPAPQALRTYADPNLVELLKNLFEIRPLWIRTSLEEFLPKTYSHWKKKPALARVAFLIQDGPWRGCLCRLTYDPRLTQSSHKYQTIDFRDYHFRQNKRRTFQIPEAPNLLPYTANNRNTHSYTTHQITHTQTTFVQSDSHTQPIHTEPSLDPEISDNKSHTYTEINSDHTLPHIQTQPIDTQSHTLTEADPVQTKSETQQPKANTEPNTLYPAITFDQETLQQVADTHTHTNTNNETHYISENPPHHSLCEIEEPQLAPHLPPDSFIALNTKYKMIGDKHTHTIQNNIKDNHTNIQKIEPDISQSTQLLEPIDNPSIIANKCENIQPTTNNIETHTHFANTPTTHTQLPILNPDDEIHFRIPPTRHSQIYQLCDIDEISIQKLIRKTELNDECSKDTGWFNSEFLALLREIMSLKSKRMREMTH